MDEFEFIKNLMKENSNELGFIPISAFKKAFNEDRLIICTVNNHNVGYLLYGPFKTGKDVRIYQLCIDKKIRKKGHGRKLFNDLYELCIRFGTNGIRVRCAYDLAANYFWKSLGFKLIDTVLSKNKERYINLYYLQIK